MSTIVRELNGLQKAGVLMISLGAEASARVFDHLTPEERDLLGAEIVKLRHVDETTRRGVLDEVNNVVLSRSIPEPPPARKSEEPDRDEPLKWLESLDAQEVAAMLARERPQNIALILAHISPQAAASILGCLSENSRNQVAHRLATMKPVAKEAIEAVDEAMRKRAGMVPTQSRGRDGVRNFLGHTTERVKESVKGALGRAETEQLPQSPRAFTSPDDMLALSDSEIKTVLVGIAFDDLCLALRVAGEDLRAAVLRNVSEEATVTLRRAINSSSQLRVREIEQAQGRIVEAMNKSFVSAKPVEAFVG